MEREREREREGRGTGRGRRREIERARGGRGERDGASEGERCRKSMAEKKAQCHAVTVYVWAHAVRASSNELIGIFVRESRTASEKRLRE